MSDYFYSFEMSVNGYGHPRIYLAWFDVLCAGIAEENNL